MEKFQIGWGLWECGGVTSNREKIKGKGVAGGVAGSLPIKRKMHGKGVGGGQPNLGDLQKSVGQVVPKEYHLCEARSSRGKWAWIVSKCPVAGTRLEPGSLRRAHALISARYSPLPPFGVKIRNLR